MNCEWSKLDKIETDCEKPVNLKNDGPTFFKLKSICMKQVVNNAKKSCVCYVSEIPSLN